MTDATLLLGRLLLSLIFVWSGIGKLQGGPAKFAAMGLPFPDLAFGVAILVEVGFGLCCIFGFRARTAALVLCGWCIVTAIMFHTNFADRNMLIHFMKNVSMAGGFLYVVSFGPGAYSLDALVKQRGTRRMAGPVVS